MSGSANSKTQPEPGLKSGTEYDPRANGIKSNVVELSLAVDEVLNRLGAVVAGDELRERPVERVDHSFITLVSERVLVCALVEFRLFDETQ